MKEKQSEGMRKQQERTYYEGYNDALRGEHLIAEAKDIKKRVIQRKKIHRGQIADIKGEVKDRCAECGTLLWGQIANIKGSGSICYISKPIRTTKGKESKQKKDSSKKGIKYKY